MHYLILGGSGFIGTNLVRYLLNASEQNEVTVVDNLSTGKSSNLADLWSNDRFRSRLSSFHSDDADISDKGTLSSFYYDKPDVIYNLACPASPKYYQADPIQTIMTTTMGVKNALDLAKDTGARFFQASTSEVYGDPFEHPQTESYHGNVNTWGPRACYDEGKRLAETLCYEYRNSVDLRIARIFNTYGPWMARDDGRVVSNFICQALAGENLTIYGNGSQTRSVCYIDDLIQGFMTLMASDVKEPVNIGNPVELTIKQIAELILELTKSRSIIEYKELPKDDPKQRCPDIRKIQSLGWQPVVSPTDGLTKTISYFSNTEAI